MKHFQNTKNPFANTALILVCLTVLLSIYCQDARLVLGKKYEGFWYETRWNYVFKDNTFVFSTEGHYGEILERGNYQIKGTKINLIPMSTEHVDAGVLKTNLQLSQNGCLIDLQNNFYCKR